MSMESLALLPEAGEAGPVTPIARTHRILVVDDDEVFRSMLVEALEDEGFDVVGAATDGVAGVELTQSLRPDAVMLDVRMPGLDGLAAARQIRDFDQSVRLVFLSAYDDPTLKREAQDVAAADFLIKGCRLGELVQALSPPA
jgi:CheY-like chemotaxis protein